jgi:hypothetical protein
MSSIDLTRKLLLLLIIHLLPCIFAGIRLVSVLTVLDKLGYIPVPSKAEHIVSESIKESLESLFGQAASAVLLNNLSSIYGLSENELTTNYDIFEKSLYKISGYGAKIILGYLKKEILIKALAASSDSEITEQDIVNPEVGIGDIIKKISFDEITEFVYRIPSSMHIVLVYENEATKYKILDAFFDKAHNHSHQDTTTTTTASNTITSTMIPRLIRHKQTKCGYANDSLYYDDLLCIDKSQIVKKIWNWINSFDYRCTTDIVNKYDNKEIIAQDKDDIIVSPSPSPSTAIRIAIEDASWFLVNNFRHEFLSLEEIIKKNISNFKSTSILCVYKKTRISGHDVIDEEMIMTMVESHSYVILEEPPFIIYMATKS